MRFCFFDAVVMLIFPINYPQNKTCRILKMASLSQFLFFKRQRVYFSYSLYSYQALNFSITLKIVSNAAFPIIQYISMSYQSDPCFYVIPKSVHARIMK